MIHAGTALPINFPYAFLPSQNRFRFGDSEASRSMAEGGSGIGLPPLCLLVLGGFGFAPAFGAGWFPGRVIIGRFGGRFDWFLRLLQDFPANGQMCSHGIGVYAGELDAILD